tara:strand:+ start:542 stop:1378 length:837 start_codon:yes stop_codon:yes gene_type:complete
MKLLIENFRKFVKEEADPTKVNPEVFPQKLSQVHPNQAKSVSDSGQADGVSPEDVVPVAHKPEGIAPVQKLKPSQSSMNIPKAMGMVLGMLNPNNPFSPGGDLGAFISNDSYIMDGHHRWVATAMIDPSLSVGGYLVDFPGEQLVAILNTMTKGKFGVMKGKEGTGGFDQFTPDNMKKQLMIYAQKGVTAKKPKDAMNPEEVMSVLKTFTGGLEGEAAVDAAVNKMSENIGTLTFATPSWASDRTDMPVVDGDANVAAAAKALAGGEVNVNPPYKSQK